MYFIRLMAFLWERDESPNVHLPVLSLPVKGKLLFSTGRLLSEEDAFPIGCMGGREIIIIIYDVQNSVSACLYKYQAISSVPALKPPRAISFLFIFQPRSLRPSTPAPRKGLSREPTLLGILRAAKLQYPTRENKRHRYCAFHHPQSHVWHEDDGSVKQIPRWC